MRLIKKIIIILFVILSYSSLAYAKGDLDGFMNALEKAKNAGLTIDADTTAKQFGYKNFNEFVIHFKSANDLDDLTIEEAKDFLLGTDNTVEIVESQENLDKLYNLIMNHKKFKKKTKYFKIFKKGKTKKGDVLDQMALAVYINYEKEMSKISQNPNLDETTRFAWGWGWSRGSGYTPFKWALKTCEEDAKKYKLSGGECIIVDHRTKNPEKVYNYLKPRLKLAKKEPKKKKVDKVVEPEQEEIKVKTKKKDTAGPIIEIVEAITVDDSSYTLKGKVSDNSSDKIYIKVDGQDIAVKKGKFKIERYSPVDEEVKIVAIDKFGNKSTKVVKVTIDIKEEMIVQKLEPLNPSRAKGKTSGEKVALIIGIENYNAAPKANYANLDAKYFFDYARKAFGAKKQNIKLLINEDATYVKTNVALTKWLRSRIKADQTDLIIFFAGHGLASSDGKELYLLPQDSDPDLLSRTALSRTELFTEIINLKPKSVTMFLDTCYSGVSRDEQMLLASARPIRIVASDEGDIPNNFTIFSASGLDQISSGFKEAKHGIFSYYLMKGLEGKADANKNKEITNGELLAYMDQNVSQKALELGRSQNPSLMGDPDQVLMRY
jgi:phage anti-repressor protein